MESHLHFAKTTFHGIVSFYIKEFPYFRGTRLALMKVWGATRIATTLRRRHLCFGFFESTRIFRVNVIYASTSSITSTRCPSPNWEVEHFQQVLPIFWQGQTCHPSSGNQIHEWVMVELDWAHDQKLGMHRNENSWPNPKPNLLKQSAKSRNRIPNLAFAVFHWFCFNFSPLHKSNN